MSSPDDTIVAISSPHGRSLRGLIRLSGTLSARILESLCSQSPPPARRAAVRHVKLSQAGTDQTLDLPCMVMCFAPPASYTGQQMVELQCPGHPSLLQRILAQALALGARLAEPGEFTFRAYLAGKLDLTQAEGIAATIAAQSDAQLHAATLLRQGKLGQLSEKLVEDLADALAAVEAGIDFTDQEDVRPIAGGVLTRRLVAIQQEINHTLTASRHWGDLDALPCVVLVGSPSVGKSTLFNALLGRQRSVISAQPGTTRDILAEPLTLTYQNRQVQVMLMDIAGLDKPASALDHQVQDAARTAMQQADLILSLGDHQTEAPAMASDSRALLLKVRTKADLSDQRSMSADELKVSATTGRGLDELKAAIASNVGGQSVSLSGQMLALAPRHERSFTHASEQIDAAMELLALQSDDSGVDQPELVAASLRVALDELAALGGRMTPDDVIGRVFAKFCVGK